MDINAQRRMLELAGMSHVVLTEAKKSTVNEDASAELQRVFGALGAAVVDILEQFKSMSTDPTFADEQDPADMAPERVQGFIEDMIDDQLAEIFASAAYKQKCAEMAGQTVQVAAQPDQRTLDV